MNYRPLVISDYQEVSDFWKSNFEVSGRDDFEHIKIFLDKNPNLSTVAIDDNNRIVGTVLASYDGRKAYIQKMVIHKDLRGSGYGKEILEITINKLKEIGAKDIRVSCSEKLVPFYKKCGFEVKPIVTLQIRNY